MDPTSLSALISGILFFVLGAVVIGAIWYFQSFARKSTHQPGAEPPADPGLSEVARLMRDMKSQDLVVMMEGKTYKTPQELTPALNHRLSFTSQVLSDWLAQAPAVEVEQAVEQSAVEMGETAVDKSAINEARTDESVAMADIVENVPAEPSEGEVESEHPELKPGEDESAISDQVSAEEEIVTSETELNEGSITPPEPAPATAPPYVGEPASEVKPVSMNLQDVISGIINPSPKPALVFKSIATQINDILQSKIAGSPYEARAIAIKDAPDHGVIVTLDGQSYQGVGDVPDDQVRELIHTAVEEWERQQTAKNQPAT